METKHTATITKKVKIDLDITNITLLSKTDAMGISEDIRCIGKTWWLRSPGFADCDAVTVGSNGRIYMYGNYVSTMYAVRPVLVVSNLKSFNLQTGDKFKFADNEWIVISNDKALCANYIGECMFRKDNKATDANIYEKSDVKKYVEDWAKPFEIKVA